jgi:hypothetical protein
MQIVLGCKIPHELDALKWKATGSRRSIKNSSTSKLATNKTKVLILLPAS